MNIKNTNPQKISEICKSSEAKKGKDKLVSVLQGYGISVNENDLPSQCGIGNYDYDYANNEMIENVKLQMLYLILTCEDQKGENFRDFLKNNIELISSSDDTKSFIKNINSSNYDEIYNNFFNELELECKAKGLLDYEKLKLINAWSDKLKRPICPLCSKPLTPKNFFEEILQAEGRQVQDNTQREVVLMHVSALRAGKLNHRIYNLGWGHNFCNKIQGDNDIKDTIEELEKIIKTYYDNTK